MSSFEVQQQIQQQGGISGLNNKGYESVVIRDEASCVVQQESSGDSGTTLKAHDYIGLSEVSSMAASGTASEKSIPDLNIGETELRLGPPKSSAGSTKDMLNDNNKMNNKQSSSEDVHKFWQAQVSRNAEQVRGMIQEQLDHHGGGGGGGGYTNQNQNLPKTTVSGAKRGFTEALGSAGFVDGRPNASGSGPNGKSPMMYPWTTSKQLPAAWRMGLEQSKGSFGPFPSPARPMHKQPEDNNNTNNNATGWDSASSSPISKVSNASKEDASDEVAPSSSPPVVGWPPVQSFRKNTLASHPPPATAAPNKSSSTTETNNKTSSVIAPSGTNPSPAAPQGVNNPLFVKVYMDGVPIGRKVDLKAHNSYEKLSSVLEEMFHRFITGQNGAEVSSSRDATMTNESKKLNFLHGSEFVLTYEDRDGDLMLVGDVPWGMFTGTVKRLRIMKGSEAIGLAPRPASGDNNKVSA